MIHRVMRNDGEGRKVGYCVGDGETQRVSRGTYVKFVDEMNQFLELILLSTNHDYEIDSKWAKRRLG